MPNLVDLQLIDEGEEEPADLLEALPEVRYEVPASDSDDDLGIRSLLERPEAFAHPWWRDQARRGSNILPHRGRSPTAPRS